ncbi:EamA family transporter [Tateyamaria pelophila]|uniref:EamA family transporter n=1 Tax=Tateyamaria pelophila TaxID=328415 RepID=UPI001CC05A55|nr:hypothetical protein [Tateyamaria pelophila]
MVRSLAVCGLFLGGAFSRYASSLLLTDVVRALLPFHLTPIWGTALRVFFLGEMLPWTRVANLLMALAGLLVVLGIGDTVPLPRNSGDWPALLSGVCRAIGALKSIHWAAPTPSNRSLPLCLAVLWSRWPSW